MAFQDLHELGRPKSAAHLRQKIYCDYNDCSLCESRSLVGFIRASTVTRPEINS